MKSRKWTVLFVVFFAFQTIVATSLFQQDSLQINAESFLTIEQFPKDYQLFARNKNNNAKIEISGTIVNPVESVIVKILGPNNAIKTRTKSFKKNFNFKINLDAVLHNYRIELFVRTLQGEELLIKTAKQVVVGDVYVVHGQSNAWAIDYDDKYNAKDLPENTKWVRTMGAMHAYNKPASYPEVSNSEWFIASGKAPNMKNGQFAGAGMIGVLGMRLGLNLVNSEEIPIAIINGAGGGGAIAKYQKKEGSHFENPYGRLFFRLQKSGLSNSIKAFIWNQGENNSRSTTESYKMELEQLYQSFESDFSFDAFYLIQTPPGCNASNGHSNVREAQRQFASENKAVYILTRHGLSPNPDTKDGNYFLEDGCHYHAHGYEVLADWIAGLAKFHFYDGEINYQAPTPLKISMESETSLIIKFDREIKIQPSLLVEGKTYDVKDHLFAINGNLNSNISTIELVKGNSKKVRLTFEDLTLSKGDTLTYILNDNYPDSSMPYIGPWLIDATTGIGAVGFTKTIE